MKIGLLGANSNIARDLIHYFHQEVDNELYLFTRNEVVLRKWLVGNKIESRYKISKYNELNNWLELDLLINFIGTSNPAATIDLGASILDITYKYDSLALDYLKKTPKCKYIFLSSGVVFGSEFNQPVNLETNAIVPLNNLNYQNWYSVSKLYAEVRHRSMPELSIIDLRIFNYFSHRQDMNSSFLIAGIVKAIREKKVFITAADEIVRDFINPLDFYHLILKIVSQCHLNIALDCYSKQPVTKRDLLASMEQKFGLMYKVSSSGKYEQSATGLKPLYYSANMEAAVYGYAPTYTSIDGLEREFNLLFY